MASKRYREIAKAVDKEKLHTIEEGIRLAKQTASVKFDAAIDVHIKLNIDPKQSDQRVRTQVMLPHGTGKKIKVAAFVSGAKEKAAKDAGADVVGGEELVKQIKETGKTDFDVAVAEPALMRSLASVAKILGQRGLMPNPKAGTVGEDIAKLVKELKSGKVEITNDESGVIHQIIGRASFGEEQLLENFKTVKDALHRAKPASVKRDFIGSITVAATMGPGIKVKN